MGLIFIILIIFSVVWFLVWFWFFKPSGAPTENFYKLGLKAFEAGDYKKAKELFSRIPNANSILDAKYKLGIACMKLKEYEEAQNYFDYILKKSPKNKEALQNLVESLKAQKKYDEALMVCNKIEKQDNKNLDNILNMSQIYSEKGELSKALEILEKSKKDFPNHSGVLLAIANCKIKMCNMENNDECKQILEEYTKLADRNDLPRDFYIGIAKAYAMNGELEKAFSSCQKAINLKSEDVEAYQLLGLIQLLKKDIESAKKSLTMALNFQPNNKETHNIFSYVLCQNVNSCTLSKCRENYYKLVKNYLR